jgi:hypothetical protein
LSVTMFERMPLLQVLTEHEYKTQSPEMHNQLNLFD